MTTTPKHTRSIVQERKATAPYNFIMLPDVEEMLLAVTGYDLQHAKLDNNLSEFLDKKLPSHDTYSEKLKSGYFEVELETLSPLFVGGESQYSETEDKDSAPNKKNFFSIDSVTKNPVIPGSSLKGMLRSVVEIISFGKVGFIQKNQLFYRDPSNRESYQNKMTIRETHNNRTAFRSMAKTGRLTKSADGAWKVQECKAVRVHLKDVASAFGLNQVSKMYQTKDGDINQKTENNPNQYPKSQYQHREVWVNNVGEETWQEHQNMYLFYATAGRISEKPIAGYQKGQLLLTGPMQKKARAFIFLESDDIAAMYTVPPSLLESVNGSEQITEWQENAFSDAKGSFTEGSLVFFTQKDGYVTAMGRAQLFRIGYIHRPIDLLPSVSTSPFVVDYAEAMFGFVRTGEEIKKLRSSGYVNKDDQAATRLESYSGRISVTDGKLQNPSNDNPWLSSRSVTLPTLGTPHPSSFQLYLTQPDQTTPKVDDNNRNIPPKLYDYNYSSEKSCIRGTKRYWHKGNVSVTGISATEKVAPTSTQHVSIQPCRSGLIFSFRIYFENLNSFELNMLCWAITLGQSSTNKTTLLAHSLGMGKSLGMGAVRLKPKLHLIDRKERYKKLFLNTSWFDGQKDLEGINVDDFSSKFEKTLLSSQAGNKSKTFSAIPRIEQFLKMAEWSEDISLRQQEERRHQVLTERRNDFRDRKVLPDPRDMS